MLPAKPLLWANRRLPRSLLLLLGAHLARPAGADLTFYAIGDWGAASKWVVHDDADDAFDAIMAEDRATMLAVAAAMGKAAAGGLLLGTDTDDVEPDGPTTATTPPSFVLALGDNFYEDGVGSSGDKQWSETWRSVWVDPFPALAGVAWLPVLGNHDYHRGVNGAEAQVVRTTATDDDEWQLPSTAWTRTFALGPGGGGHRGRQQKRGRRRRRGRGLALRLLLVVVIVVVAAGGGGHRHVRAGPTGVRAYRGVLLRSRRRERLGRPREGSQGEQAVCERRATWAGLWFSLSFSFSFFFCLFPLSLTACPHHTCA